MKTNKYMREIKPGVFVDVYDVLNAFKTGSSAVDHAVKKLLAPGQRGVKSREQDLNEAIASIRRAVEIENPMQGVTVEEQKPDEPRLFICNRCDKYSVRHADEGEPEKCDHCECDALTPEYRGES